MHLLPNSRYHISFLGKVGELLEKLDPLLATNQHVDCLHKLFEYRFSGKIVVNSGQVFDIVQKTVCFKGRPRGVDRMPSIVKKRLLRKKFRKPLLGSFQKTKSTQTSGSVFARRIEQSEKTKNGLNLFQSVHCFLDGYGSYSSNLVNFENKSFKEKFFATRKSLET